MVLITRRRCIKRLVRRINGPKGRRGKSSLDQSQIIINNGVSATNAGAKPMNHSILAKILFPLLSASLIALGLLQSASGAVVGTESAMQLQQRTAQIKRISAVFAEQQFRDQLVRFGVDPQYATLRVAALSDSELQALDQRISELPAGGNGVFEVLGIVLLVLLVLELVGVTDIFKSF